MGNVAMARRQVGRRVPIQQSVDRLFNEAFWHGPFRTLWASTGTGNGNGRAATRWPLPLDVYTTENDVVIIAAVPGVAPDDIQITFDQGVLTVTGQLASAAGSEEGKGATWYLHELPYGTFQRSVTLPFDVDADVAEATFEHGILRLRLPKAERARPKQIKVQLVEHDETVPPAEAITAESA